MAVGMEYQRSMQINGVCREYMEKIGELIFTGDDARVGELARTYTNFIETAQRGALNRRGVELKHVATRHGLWKKAQEYTDMRQIASSNLLSKNGDDGH